MVFTERQKNELKCIAKEVSKEILKELIYDNDFMDSLSEKLADKVSQKVSNHIDKLTTQVNILEQKINFLQGEHDEMKRKLENLEQNTKINLLRIYGIPENNDGNLMQKVKETLESKLEVKDVTLEHCYRIGQKTNNKNKPRAVVIKFSNTQQRNMVFFNKKLLKGSKIIIMEELVKSKHELLTLAKEKLGKGNVWTINGRIYTKLNGKRICLKNEDDIINLNN